MIIEDWGGGKEASWRGEWNLQRWNEAGREENLKMEGIDLKGSMMVRRWRKDKGSYMEDETKWKRIVMVISLNHLVPVITLETCFLFLYSWSKPFSLGNPFLLYCLCISILLPILPAMQLCGFTCHAVVDREAHIGVLIKIMTRAPVSLSRKMLSDKDS